MSVLSCCHTFLMSGFEYPQVLHLMGSLSCSSKCNFRSLSRVNELSHPGLLQGCRISECEFICSVRCEGKGKFFPHTLQGYLHAECMYECFFRDSGLLKPLPHSSQSSPSWVSLKCRFSFHVVVNFSLHK